MSEPDSRAGHNDSTHPQVALTAADLRNPPSQDEAVKAKLFAANWDKAALLIGTAAVYGSGFIVANAFLERYTVPSFDLLRVRYISAAIVFLCLTLAPSSVAFYWGRSTVLKLLGRHGLTLDPHADGAYWNSLKSLPKQESRVARWRVNRAILMTGVVSFVIGEGIWTAFILLSGMAVDPRVLLGWAGFWYGFQSICSILLVLSIIPRYMRQRDIPNTLFWIAWCFALYAGLAISFGRTIYPYIRPAVGGGGVWAVRIALKDSVQVSQELRSRTSGPVLLLDRDEKQMQLLYCSAPDARLQSIELPREYVEFVEMDSITSVPGMQRACKVRHHISSGAIPTTKGQPRSP